ncbi:MAG: reverse transcriptase-like protein [Propionibacteriales bacterium]|nr:reverse transcriptase-like protein [Propionibacteriales bacterium]
MTTHHSVIIEADGGSRGNPGPAGFGSLLRDADTGEVIAEAAEAIGRATNNVAEYRALLLGIERALELGASELDLVGDSELVVKQVQGKYKVKDAGLKPLHAAVRKRLEGVGEWSIRHVRRERNAEADRLVNEALDAA